MASIRERAAALQLAEKLRVRPPGVPVHSSSSSSSSMWNLLISHLRSSVTVKRRRVHLKSHSDCFVGSEAVDVLMDHIGHMKGLQGSDICRDKVVLVCQSLLNCSVFESVGAKMFGKDKKQDEFQDSKNALYRFVGVGFPSVEELEKGVLVDGIHKLFSSDSSHRQEEQKSDPGAASGLMVDQMVENLSPSRVQSDSGLPQSRKAYKHKTCSESSKSVSHPLQDAAVSSSVVDEVWQEQTLLRLLTLVDLPLLDGVLHCSSSSPSSNRLLHSNPDLIYSSNHLDRRILRAFRDAQDDEFLRSALDCLDFLPDQPVVELSRELPQCFPPEEETSAGINVHDGAPSGDDQVRLSHAGLVQCKLLLYETLAKHYSNTNRPPLLPDNMTDIYSTIIDLLVNAKLGKALEALQLCLKLLPIGCRDELRRLLAFMSLAADPQEIKVDKEMENRLAVKKSFSRAILHSKAFSKEKEDLMVVFMLSNINEIFKIPGALHKEVSDKLAVLVQGKQPDVTGSTFCLRVSSRTEAESMKKTTNQELWVLLNNIHLDTKISAKKKKRLLRQFNQSHPEIFNQYFGESAVSLL
ncbi:DEP domain-containing protein 7-like [Acanthochromis polyacanthus]|uniref:DEP domain-containing protein 7-like n=1 Tax=Acanthochromis polyacanthus TaxID=80966 RepID=UPI002234CA9B|nr:DEP domain-containing protein 7-like [Acanthochromis polyacanthus]